MFQRRTLGVTIASLLLCVSVTTQAFAYDWCSQDPTWSFQASGSSTVRSVDFTVRVSQSAIPLVGAATLRIDVPSNVSCTLLSNPSGQFTITTTCLRDLPSTGGGAYTIQATLTVPDNGTHLPVELVSTRSGPLTKTTDGMSGQAVVQQLTLAP